MMNDVALLYAKAFLYIADPYGDGIRLEHIRNPSPAYRAAQDLVYEGQHTLDGLELMKQERGSQIAILLCSPSWVSEMVRNTDLTRADVKVLKRFVGIRLRP
jgi:hypothetical protein